MALLTNKIPGYIPFLYLRESLPQIIGDCITIAVLLEITTDSLVEILFSKKCLKHSNNRGSLKDMACSRSHFKIMCT